MNTTLIPFVLCVGAGSECRLAVAFMIAIPWHCIENTEPSTKDKSFDNRDAAPDLAAPLL